MKRCLPIWLVLFLTSWLRLVNFLIGFVCRSANLCVTNKFLEREVVSGTLNDLRAYINQAKRREVIIAKVTYKPSRAGVGGTRSKRDRVQKRQLSMLLSILWKLFNEIIWGNGFIYLSILLETSTMISHDFSIARHSQKTGKSMM